MSPRTPRDPDDPGWTDPHDPRSDRPAGSTGPGGPEDPKHPDGPAAPKPRRVRTPPPRLLGAYRGRREDRGFPVGLALPPDPLPPRLAGRMRKQWRYVGAYGPELSVCVGVVHVGPLMQSFWAVWDRGEGRLRERTRSGEGGVELEPGRVLVRDRGVAIELVLDEDRAEQVETVTPYGTAHAWTAKRAGVGVRGTVALDGRELPFDGFGVVDDSAGYPPRRTAWRWSAGVGIDTTGRRIGWNLVDGIHDDPDASERSVWIDGEAAHVAPVVFAADLSGVRTAAPEDEGGGPADGRGDRPASGSSDAASGGPEVDLRFTAEATRKRRDNLLVVRSRYEQPFGTFTGTLPGGVELATGFGVMERHVAVW